MTYSILVTGGAGFLGINFIRYLLEKKQKFITSLDIADFDYPEKGLIREIKGDIRNRRIVFEAVKGQDWVIHAAAALPLYKKADIYTTEIEGTGNLLEAAYGNGVKRFVYISSTAVYGIPENCPIAETDRLEGVGPYGEAKIEAEKLCEEYRRKGMTISVLRPKTFIGPERLGVFELLYSWAVEGRNFPIIGRGLNRYQLLDVQDLCEAVYLCSTLEKETVNSTFNIGARDFSTFREDYQSVLDAAGYGKRIIPIPSWIAVGFLKLLEILRLSPVYRWVYETAGKDSSVSIGKAQRELGFIPEFSNQDALRRNFNWYKESSRKKSGGHGLTHRTSWSHGILRILKLFF